MSKSCLLVLSILTTSWLFAAEKTVTLEGTLVSASCYLPDKSEATTGNDMGGAKECGSGCLKQGKPGGLLTNDNVFYLLDAPSLALAPYVGQHVRITGQEYSRDIFLVRTAFARSGGGWETIDLHHHQEATASK